VATVSLVEDKREDNVAGHACAEDHRKGRLIRSG
jgi:hypothetical protein